MTEEKALEKARTKIQAQRATIANFLEKAKPALARRLAGRMGSAEFAASIATECEKNPQLAECTPLSIIGGAYEIAQVGLRLGGALGQAYLVPFRNGRSGQREAQVIFGYKGLIALAELGGSVRSVSGRVVYEGDEWDYEEADEHGKQLIRHKPARPSERGDPVAVYARIHKAPDMPPVFHWIWWEEVLKLRKAAEDKARGRPTPWTTWTEQMGIKTAIRRELKYCRMSVDAMRAVTLDELAEGDIDQGLEETGGSLVDEVQDADFTEREEGAA